jgi:hypothetical protein
VTFFLESVFCFVFTGVRGFTHKWLATPLFVSLYLPDLTQLIEKITIICFDFVMTLLGSVFVFYCCMGVAQPKMVSHTLFSGWAWLNPISWPHPLFLVHTYQA